MNKLIFCLVIGLVVSTVGVSSPLVLNCPGGMQDLTANAAVTFGGTGIPKDAVCSGNFGGVDVVLVAHQRFSNPTVMNDGVASYSALVGNDVANGQPQYGVWNFAFYAKNNSGGARTVQLSWDTNPGANTDVSQFGFLTQPLASGATVQDSYNLGMGFIDTGFGVPLVYSPAAGLFNPFAVGEYGFRLKVSNVLGQNLGMLGMEVNTSTEVPEPRTLVTIGAGLLLGGIARRKRLQ